MPFPNPGYAAWLRRNHRQDMIRDLRSGKYDNAGAAPADVLGQLASATELFDSISEKAARYRGYEELFGQQPSRGLDDVEQVGMQWVQGVRSCQGMGLRG